MPVRSVRSCSAISGATVIKVNGLFDLFWHRVHIAYMANRGKQSITLNLKDPRAMKILLDLVAKADVVQHNMRYDAAERLKIDYESLKQINPKLIYAALARLRARRARAACRATTRPAPACPASSSRTAAWAAPAITAKVGRPLWSFTSFGDTGNGFLSATAIINALYHRDRTGEGQFVDTSIINAALLNTSYAVATPDGKGFERPRIGGDQVGYSAGSSHLSLQGRPMAVSRARRAVALGRAVRDDRPARAGRRHALLDRQARRQPDRRSRG